MVSNRECVGYKRAQLEKQIADNVELQMATPRKGKAKVKVTSSGKKVSYGQAGNAKGGGPRVLNIYG